MIIELSQTNFWNETPQSKESYGEKAFYAEYKGKSAVFIEVGTLEEAIDYLKTIPLLKKEGWRKSFILEFDYFTEMPFKAKYKIEIYNDYME
ncbi:MAG: hypothetical protein FWE02_03740 [Defluviitaleaceae bacterium]|nr:hypothetical protein [Defluviitaleaceae bacterium]